jgi:hypothetical protein
MMCQWLASSVNLLIASFTSGCKMAILIRLTQTRKGLQEVDWGKISKCH